MMDVRFENVTKRFSETIAVNNVSLTFKSGKLTGLLGPSGCGKSTTLYMIAGLLKPTEGRIFFGEDDVTALAPEKRGIGLVFQNYALYPHMTVRQNILFPLENMKVKREEAIRRMKEMADLVGIGNLLDRKPVQLSGGQQQRVAIARALVKMPRVLLLDEPLSNLDARLRLQTREEIKRIQRETGITTIFVTHDQEEAMSISDEIVVMDHGVIQQIGHPQEVYNNPINLFVSKFLGNPPINVFEGEIVNGKVLVGGAEVASVNYKDRKVFVGVRPEDFTTDPNGFEVNIDDIQTIGRDIILHFKLGGKPSRAIISANQIVNDRTVKIKAVRFHLFDQETGDLVAE